MSSPLRVLIFDSNTVFARQVGSWLKQLMPGTHVDYAAHFFALKRRCRDYKYNVILADPLTVANSEDVNEVLAGVQDTTPVIVWSFMNTESKYFSKNEFMRVLKKPSTYSEVVPMVDQLALA